ncbi:MAG: glucosaminidase domain-containing protein [Immundisolibacteraceae bacterium]|nr:glucosaminidase domain-containing protein [Immundisolibacteraceae bacterium]
MTSKNQQLLLTTFLLVGALVIAVVSYRSVQLPVKLAPVEPLLIVAPLPIKTPAQPMAEKPLSPPVIPVSVKKERFFSRLIPLVQQQNEATRQLQQRILVIRQLLILEQTLTATDQQLINHLIRRYRLTKTASVDIALIDLLLTRVDLLPPSLALAQAANESAWGQSRFALQANNLYGQWCFKVGCGLVPKSRPEGMNHEVASYPSWQQSVAAYFLNLNSHPAYQPLRDIRAGLRQQNLPLNGEQLAVGLEKYSARGSVYVESLQKIIRVNNLAALDQI